MQALPPSSAEPPWSSAAERRAPPDPAVGPHLFTVSELTRTIKGRLDELGRVSVEGEVSRITQAASGHLYFDIKDLDAKLACTVWKSQVASALRFDLKEGLKVIAHGKLDVYAPRGTYSLNVHRLEEKGIGALLVELEKLREELRARGWFDRHRPLPALPRVIGVVTSRDGAAFQDFLRTRSLRWPLYPVRLAHTPVQGAGAAREIATAIRRLDQSGVDVIVVCRGGGSLEDLWAFNELPVVEAVWAATVPVVSGVGHETDVTLCDLVADHRAHTPTDAAQTVLPDRRAILEELERHANHLARAMDEMCASYEERWKTLARSRVLRDPSWILEEQSELLAALLRRLPRAAELCCERAAARLDGASFALARHSPALELERRALRMQGIERRLSDAVRAPLDAALRRVELAGASLSATSPFGVLARGYSITRRAGTKTPLVRASGLAPDEELETRLAEGWIVSKIRAVHEAEGSS